MEEEFEEPNNDLVSSDNDGLQTLNKILSLLSEIDGGARERVLRTVLTFYSVGPNDSPNMSIGYPPRNEPTTSSAPQYSDSQSISPKDFLLDKQPQSDVERIACLAFYLTHFRDTPYFKTIDISKLNTEAAQPKLSNAAYSVGNAVKQGYLAPALKGQRQVSAAGEQFV